MQFLTSTEFIKDVGAEDCFVWLSGMYRDLDEQVFEKVRNGEDVSGEDAAAVTLAQKALASLEQDIDYANRTVAGYVQGKYPELSASDINNSVLPKLASKIAIVEVQIEASEYAIKERDGALKTLDKIQSGTVTLGIPEPAPVKSSGIQVSQGYSNFNWSQYGR